MGCLCNHRKNNLKQNLSQTEQPQQSQSNIILASKYRQQGKSHFRNRNFQQAIKSYKLALNNQPNNLVHFTNLALAQKADKHFCDSIQTIDRMERQFMIKSSEGNKAYLVKGMIIRARCQTIEAANFLLKTQNYRITDCTNAKTLIKNAITSLTTLSHSPQLIQIANQLNIQKYLQNANKINTMIHQLDIYLDDQMIKYVTTKLTAEQNINKFHTLEISQYFNTPQEIISELIKWEKQNVRNRFFGEQQQEFIVDPITYEQFTNPILVQSGFTYQQKTLKNHYQKNGTYDPITRQPFTHQLGVKNNVLLAYILQTNKWFTLNQQNNLDL